MKLILFFLLCSLSNISCDIFYARRCAGNDLTTRFYFMVDQRTKEILVDNDNNFSSPNEVYSNIQGLELDKIPGAPEVVQMQSSCDAYDDPNSRPVVRFRANYRNLNKPDNFPKDFTLKQGETSYCFLLLAVCYKDVDRLINTFALLSHQGGGVFPNGFSTKYNLYAGQQTPQYAGQQTPQYAGQQTPQYAAGQTPQYAAGQTPQYPAGQTQQYPAGQTQQYPAGQIPQIPQQGGVGCQPTQTFMKKKKKLK
jgi:hypothetical protein